MNKVNKERSVSVEIAIILAEKFLESRNLRIELKSTSKIDSYESTVIESKLLDSHGNTLSLASGKGLGIQSKASAIFEAIEHAVYDEKIETINQDFNFTKLNNRYISKNDLLYKFLSEKYSNIRTVKFYEIDKNFSLKENFIEYPAVLSNIKGMDDALKYENPQLNAYNSTSGYACGTSIKDAILHSVHEIVERDAESQFILELSMGKRSYRCIKLSKEHYLRKELECFPEENVQVYLLDSLAGYVVCSHYKDKNCNVYGYGASGMLDIALERAITEMHQMIVAENRNITWEDEGGVSLNNLDRYPNMKNIAIQDFDLDKNNIISLEKINSPERNVIKDLRDVGLKAFARVVFNDKCTGVSVVQVKIPGCESLGDLVFGVPMLTTGRLANKDVHGYLLKKGIEQ